MIKAMGSFISSRQSAVAWPPEFGAKSPPRSCRRPRATHPLARRPVGAHPRRPFEPWFLRSVVNASIKLMKKSERIVQFGDETDESVLVDLVMKVNSIESQAEFAEVQSQIWDAMQKLSPRQRAVIVQRYYLEMSEAEMAKGSGTAAGTIKWLLNAARTRLRSLLAGRSDE